MTLLHVICGLAPHPIQNPSYAYASNYVQCAYHIPVVVFLCCFAHLHLCLLTTLQRCKIYVALLPVKKFFWYASMEWNMEENFSIKWKILSIEWKWNGRKLPVWNMEKSSSIPFHTMPCLLDVQQLKGQCEASAVCGRQVGRWQLDSKTERSLRCLLTKAS